jgi:two-component system, chemotaxis family, chemotaxis protein CheY
MAASLPRVLVIDDMAGVRESLRAALRGAGFDVATANDGREGLEALAAGTFDIVVTDIWMPEVDGLNVIKRIRATQPHLRVFAMTGGGPRLTIEAAGSIAEVWGAERVFVKPFDEAALIAAIKAPRG